MCIFFLICGPINDSKYSKSILDILVKLLNGSLSPSKVNSRIILAELFLRWRYISLIHHLGGFLFFFMAQWMIIKAAAATRTREDMTEPSIYWAAWAQLFQCWGSFDQNIHFVPLSMLGRMSGSFGRAAQVETPEHARPEQIRARSGRAGICRFLSVLKGAQYSLGAQCGR